MSAQDQDDQAIIAALQRAELLGLQGREEEGLVQLAQAQSDAPSNPALLIMQAWLFVRLDRIDSALRSAQLALDVDPDNLDARLQMANAYLHQREGKKAKELLESMLQTWPDDPRVHAYLAFALAQPFSFPQQKKALGRIGRKQQSLSAKAHVHKALELAPENAAMYEAAARVLSLLGGHYPQALAYADQGLAMAPDDLSLLEIRAVIVERLATQSNQLGSIRAGHQAGVAEADRILRVDPEDQMARLRLFTLLWKYRTWLIDTPLIGLVIVLFTIARMFTESGQRDFFPGLIYITIIVVFRLSNYFRVVRKINPAFKRSVIHGSRHSTLRIILGVVSWVVLLATAGAMTFVNNSVVVRWLIVAAGLAVLASLTASLLWHFSFSETSRRVGGSTDNELSIYYLTEHRRDLLMQVTSRVLFCIFFFSLLRMSPLRTDALSMTYLAFAAVVLPPLVGLVLADAAERRSIKNLHEESAVRATHDGPRPINTIIASILAITAVAILLVNLVRFPIVSNKYDELGSYGSGHHTPTPTTSEYSPLDTDSFKSPELEMPSLVVPTLEVPRFDLTSPSG